MKAALAEPNVAGPTIEAVPVTDTVPAVSADTVNALSKRKDEAVASPVLSEAALKVEAADSGPATDKLPSTVVCETEEPSCDTVSNQMDIHSLATWRTTTGPLKLDAPDTMRESFTCTV